MNNEWLNKLRSRMEDHEEDVPEGLWDDIREELFSEEETDKFIAGAASQERNVMKGPGKSNDQLLYRIGGLAAAVAVLLFFLMRILPQDKKDNIISLNSSGAKKDNRKNPVIQKEQFTEEKSDSGSLMVKEQGKDVLKEKNTTDSPVDRVGFNELFIERVFKGQKTAGIIPQDLQIAQGLFQLKDPVIVPEKGANDILFKQEDDEDKFADNTKNPAKKPWMLSMLTGNASSNAEQQFPGYVSMNGKPMGVEEVWSTSTYEDNPLTAVLLANQSQPVEARIRHKVPVTFGLSVYRSLGKRWGIGTGLNYTKLTSELHSGSDNNYIKGEQSVHYIGVPVQINYNVIQKGRVTGYITGGALVEKPVSGSLTTTYVVNDQIKETSKEKLENKSVQLSVNTGVGVQLKVIDKFGIYAEPGIGYHFKANNDLNTVYKEKPLQFNIKFGIRLLLD
ncbi:outer membrane beta-barrel protein [Chryseobacterium flavum]|uniref:outer membrane beta-barrel protein n=1 Tax=Chryseobacterium flavum TaxID=415851 RepID=UPI0028AB3D50|nr:outer membrane beta-barrel protein [Chryseobacterium flavum]